MRDKYARCFLFYSGKILKQSNRLRFTPGTGTKLFELLSGTKLLELLSGTKLFELKSDNLIDHFSKITQIAKLNI